MKRLVMFTLTAAVLMVVTSPVQAASGQRVRAQQGSRSGVFGRLMELERRKNAALRQMLNR